MYRTLLRHVLVVQNLYSVAALDDIITIVVMILALPNCSNSLLGGEDRRSFKQVDAIVGGYCIICHPAHQQQLRAPFCISSSSCVLLHVPVRLPVLCCAQYAAEWPQTASYLCCELLRRVMVIPLMDKSSCGLFDRRTCGLSLFPDRRVLDTTSCVWSKGSCSPSWDGCVTDNASCAGLFVCWALLVGTVGGFGGGGQWRWAADVIRPYCLLDTADTADPLKWRGSRD